MRFFKLTHPEYANDRESVRRNPVTLVRTHYIPSIVCSVCGVWASSVRLRMPLSSKVASEFQGIRFLSAKDWMQARSRWARLLKVEAERIEPGAVLGPPAGRCSSKIREDVVHPFPGMIWVATRVRKVIEAAKLTGVTFANVRLSPTSCRVPLSELVVHGRAWRRVSPPGKIRYCKICGHSDFRSPKRLAVDEARWDGSDFLELDHNPNIVVVTERVAEIVQSNNFTNIVVTPI